MNMNVKEFREFNVNQLNTEVICKQLLKHSKYNAVLIMNTEGMIIGISEGVESSYGYTHADVYGKYFDFLFTEDARKQHKPQLELAQVLHEGTAADYNNIVHKDGRHIWTEGEALLITDLWGDSFIIKNIHSLDKQKELEKNLLKQNKKLVRINNDLDTFVYTASHDLKSPLNNIETLVGIVQSEIQRGASADAVEPVITHINEALNRFKKTLGELTVISKVNAQPDAEDAYIDFDALLQEVTYDFQDLINRTDASIYTNFNAIPGLIFSRKNMRSMLFNLLSNALKYRSPDRRPEIRISSSIANGYVLLSVSDNGIGIAPERHEDVFKFFKRLHTDVEGTGVGMGIVKKIMDNAEGNITLESIPEKGSVFTLHFKQ